MSEYRLYDEKIDKFLNDCFSSGIKDPVRFLTDKMPRVYGFLRGAFPRGILPTDVDGEVEISGKFLRMEFKHESALREGRIPRGQARCLKSLTRTGVFTVFLIGHNDMGETTCIEVWDGNGVHPLSEATNDTLYAYCKSWAEQAEKPTN